MSIQVSCACGKVLRIKDEDAGKQFRCPGCGAVNTAVRPAFDDDDLAGPQTTPEPGRAEQNLLDRALTQDTSASNAGMVRVHIPTYFRCYPVVPSLLIAVVPIAAVVAPFLAPRHPWTWPVVLFGANFVYWYLVSMHTRQGDVNPGVVVSTDPNLVAVLADMDSTGSNPQWIIKILRQPLARMTGGPPTVGMRLGTIAMYEGDAKKGRWDNISPRVANCVTNNEPAIRRVEASIPHEQWALLEAALPNLPQPYRPGIYPVSLG
jgi:hypothetical protein